MHCGESSRALDQPIRHHAKMYAPSQRAYAPTPYSYTPSSNLTATINLDQVIAFAETSTIRTRLIKLLVRKSSSPTRLRNVTFTSPSPKSTASSSLSTPWRRLT